MISARLRQDTVTLYVYAGEVEGEPSYTRTVLTGVFFEKDYQHVKANSGIQTQDTAQLIIDLEATPVALSFPANSFFVSGEVADEVPGSKTKQSMAAERTVYTISRAYLPPNGRVLPNILELYAR